MLQIAQDKSQGANFYVVGYDLKDESPQPEEILWFSKRGAEFIEVCRTRKFMKQTGIHLKPGEGPVDIKIVRV